MQRAILHSSSSAFLTSSTLVVPTIERMRNLENQLFICLTDRETVLGCFVSHSIYPPGGFNLIFCLHLFLKKMLFFFSGGVDTSKTDVEDLVEETITVPLTTEKVKLQETTIEEE